ncbi:MAG: lactaldehyde reductase [Bacteroidales bacterium]|nr:lactaldehyde reductase [Bacteroidales bacterium]
MSANRIILNETSYFGAGSRSVIPQEIKNRGFKKALIVSDKDLVKFGVVKMVTDILDKESIPYAIYDDVKQNPTVKNVKGGVEAYKAAGADFIIAIGGGSSIDTSKGVGMIIANPDFADVVSLEGEAPTKKKSIPIIAVPTTAGTAAEVTINYVITDEERVKKMVCVDPKDIPVIAVVDAEMMLSMPKGLTAATGMDALTHAMEGYITKGAWTLTDMFELKAIELIFKYLPEAVANPSSIEARDGMATAQYIAGMGFSNVGLGIVHGMAHPLGAFYNIPHGVANALLLPYILEFNASAALPKYRVMAQAMGIDTSKMNDEEAAKAVVDAVRALSIKIGIPQKLSELNVKPEDFPALAQAAFIDVCTPGNPRDVTVEDLLALYKKAY